MYSAGGQGFIVLSATVKRGSVSRIVSRLGSVRVVTTLKNTVDKVATEYGIAELRVATIRESATRLIAIAHPDHRGRLRHEAHELGFV